MSHEFYPVYGCMDSAACNFNPRANKNDKSCNYPPEHYDCNGNCIAEIDCTGKCGGNKIIDECNICGGDNTSCADCAGIPNGTSWESDCGCVPQDNSGDECDDCAGTPNGDAVKDNCGTCDSDASNDCVQDCAGTWGGNLIDDDCGICGGDNSSCTDCAGVPNGNAVIDNCGTCDTDNSNDCIQDCAGIWGGTSTIKMFWIDLDGDGLGSGDSFEFCDGLENKFALNGTDKDDNCYSNWHDDCGICDRDNSSCADCAGTPNGSAFIDACSICSGGETNHIANSDKDCFGVCFGGSILDCKNICGGTTKIDCAGTCDGTSKRDRCGVCDGDNTSCGATYLWPTNASKTVTAFFGEERPNRYHAGLDIRTYGKIGDELFATSDGYIKKITISTKGYGKALYLQLDDGNVALYAHLNNFTEEIDKIVSALQKKNNKYSLYYTFEPDEFRVKKGDVIGYAGDTGTISGPHIHYELRDSLGKPFNPLYEYKITDNKSPIVNQIAFIPLDFNTTINELSRTQTFDFNRKTSNIYELKDTIAVNGKFGLGINVIDKVNKQPFSYGVYKIELYIDEQKAYEVSYDIYDYKDAKYIYDERDYQLKIDLGKTFYRLFSNVNKEMLFINSKYSDPYILFDDNNYHEFKIIISDFNNNKVYASGTILNKKMPILHTLHEGNHIEFENILKDANYQYDFHITGKHDLDTILPHLNVSIQDSIISWDTTEKPFSILQIDISSNDGTNYLPQYIQIINDDIPSIDGDFQLKHYQHGLILEFKTEEFINKIPLFTYEENGYRKTLKMNRVNKNIFETPLMKPSVFSQYKNIQIHFDTEPKHSFNYDIENILSIPDKKIKLLYNGGQTILKGNKYTFDDTTLLWVKDYKQQNNKNITFITNPIFVGPTRLQFNKFIELIIKIPERNNLDRSSIYKYNPKKGIWNYIPSTIDKGEIALIANIDSGGIYAVIKETQAPLISNIYPGSGGSYYQNDFREIRFNITDNESGIKDETNIKVQIDNEKPLIFEYNTYRKQVHYKLDKKMLEGKHELKIEAFDNVGNKVLKKHEFYIKK